MVEVAAAATVLRLRVGVTGLGGALVRVERRVAGMVQDMRTERLLDFSGGNLVSVGDRKGIGMKVFRWHQILIVEVDLPDFRNAYILANLHVIYTAGCLLHECLTAS